MKRQDIKRRPMPDAVIESLEPEAAVYREQHADDVYLRVKPNGAKDWQLRYQLEDGSWSWLGLGGYGKGAHQLTGQFARQQAIELIEEAKSRGVSLVAAQATHEAENPSHATFTQLVKQWLAAQRASRSCSNSRAEGSYVQAEAVLDQYVLPVMGSRDYAALSVSDWQALFSGMEDKAPSATLAQAHTYCREIYAWAQATDSGQANPIDPLQAIVEPSKKAQFPHVPLSDLPELLRAIRGYSPRPIAIGLQLLMLLAVRPAVLREAQWAEFDLEAGVWNVAAARNKERGDFLLPLPTQAIPLLHELHELQADRSSGSFLFPGRSKSMDKPMGAMAFNHALDRIGYKGRQTPNGMRSLFAVAATEAGKDHRIVDSALAHKIKGVVGVDKPAHYADQYAAQRRELLQWWAHALDTMAAG